MALSCKRVRDLASGFVLGALEIEEMNAVRDHLRTCEKDHTEFDELGGVVSYLATTVEPMEPPAWLRDSVLAAAEADLRARARTERPVPSIMPAVAHQADTNVIPFAPASGAAVAAPRRLRSRRPPVWVTRIAAAVAVLALVGYGAIVQSGLMPAKPPQATTTIDYIIGQTGVRSTDLAGTGATVGGTLALMPTGHVYCWAHGLSKTSGDQVYVVWLSLDGAPLMKVGTMPIDGVGTGLLEYDEVYPGATLHVQITLEARGDVQKPTGPVVLGGTISI